MSQSQIMTKIVSTLPTAFRNFMTVWDNLPENEKTMHQLITKLMNEQHRNVCSSPSDNKIIPANTDVEAFAAKSESDRSTNSWEDEPRNQEDLLIVGKGELSTQTKRGHEKNATIVENLIILN